MSDEDTTWLTRLSADQWLGAARGELARAYDALRAKRRREGVAYARRAAGMALNGVLRDAPAPGYGRSYVDHLRALADDEGASDPVRAAARRLVAAPLALDVVPLGPAPVDVADDALVVYRYAAGLVAAHAV